MIDRALGFSSPTQSFYFQLYPVNLILTKGDVPSSQSKFKFSVYKGLQKFDQNKIMTDANFINTNGQQIMPFRGCQLNFYLPNFNKNRKVTFTLKLNEKDANEQYQLGGVDIDPANYIQQFKEKQVNRFEQKIQLSPQFSLQYQIYIEKSRFALQKIAKSFKTERSMKSPVRQRKTPVRGRVTPTKRQDKESVKDSARESVRESAKEPVRQSAKEPVRQSANKFARNSATKAPKQEQKQQKQQPQQQKQRQRQVTINQPAKKQNEARQTAQFKVKDNQSEKSQSLVSPAVQSRQVKRHSNRNDSVNPMRLSQRLSHMAEQEVQHISQSVKKQVAEGWQSHLPLVAFTIVGVLLIYWVMHPTNRA